MFLMGKFDFSDMKGRVGTVGQVGAGLYEFTVKVESIDLKGKKFRVPREIRRQEEFYFEIK